MDRLDMRTPDQAEENFRRLAALFPGAVTETITGYDEKGNAIIERAVDADVLRQEIAACVVEGAQERYRFTWPDKEKARRASNAPTSKTLRPCRAESVGRDGRSGGFDSENPYLEGDNLEVLKLLKETYLKSVRMIYIDPPYNTGSDFVYEDDYAEDIQEYAARSGQYDGEGNRLVPNPESSGRFHTDWLNMMYPRLRLAKLLLKEEGVIFISIDDNEVDNLRKLCDEVFGPRNFIAKITWKRKKEISNDSRNVAVQGEYILCYGRSGASALGLEPISDDYVKKSYLEPTEEFSEGKWRPVPLTVSKGLSGGGYEYTVRTPGGAEHTRLWAYPEESYQKLLRENKVYFGKDGRGVPQRVMYLKESRGQPISNVWDNVATNKEGKKEILSLFGANVFDTPKPVGLIKKMLRLLTGPGDLVMDFFSGSATTAQAVMELNAEDGGGRRFIMVQWPEEPGEKSEAARAGFPNICEIGKERIRRAGRKLLAGTGAEIDYGFRVLKCDSSNMKDVYYTPAATAQKELSLLADNIREDRTAEDLLFQVMLDMGVPLSSAIEEIELGGKRVFAVGGNSLLACFEADVGEETVTEIARRRPSRFAMRDCAMASDAVAANFEQIFAAYSPDTVRKVL